ncbi:MAG: site-2 protease family protein, partial [Simkaniaceae bacterium]|nr:site-2 protease family protein [Simkaniaceae bacterium]
MIMNLIYFILAGLGLTFIVFIHELGHYIVARRNGMKVEVFSIGFGKPLLKWKVGDVEWRFCLILFGGYVKIAGFDREKDTDPYQVEGGFYRSSPWKRIKVIAMGPIVNIVFAFFVFSTIWILGGRSQSFSDHTKIIGWVDPQSELFQKGVRPGDEIDRIDGHAFRGFKDLLYSAVLSGDQVTIAGEDINYYTQNKIPFKYSIQSYPDPNYGEQGLKTFGIMQPARFLIYDDMYKVGDNAIAEDSPMKHSGIQRGDRIVWMNGELIFSIQQLNHILNQQDALISFIRDDQMLTARISKFKVRDLRIAPSDLQELGDWQHELNLKGETKDLYFIPYDISSNGVVKQHFNFIDDDLNETNPAHQSLYSNQVILKKGDRIVAIDGTPISTGYDVLSQLQHKVVRIIVQRNASYPPLLWKNEDQSFVDSLQYKDLARLSASVGLKDGLSQIGDLYLLKPIRPLKQSEFNFPADYAQNYQAYLQQYEQKINAIKDPTQRKVALKQFDLYKQQLMLGIALTDRQVIYNPNPFAMMGDVISDSYRTFVGLFTGHLNPKWLTGPVGFVQALHHGW